MRLSQGPSFAERALGWLIGALVFAFGLELLVEMIRPLVGWIAAFAAITTLVVVALRAGRGHERW